MSDPDLPLIELAHGIWRAAVIDPRPAPELLGVRYLHGGYVFRLWRDGRALTARCRDEWDVYDGDGLPEVIETALGRAEVAEGEGFQRIGIGLVAREGEGWMQGRGRLLRPAAWTVERPDPASVVMRAEDALQVGKRAWSWRLERRVRLHADGVTVASTLHLRVPWCEPVVWFAHPFWRQSALGATAVRLPHDAVVPDGFPADAAGWRRQAHRRAFGAVTGVWGTASSIEVALDPALGGGAMRVAVDRPLDKLVLFGSPHAFSPEPFWARAWHDGEEAGWTVDYRWTGT